MSKSIHGRNYNWGIVTIYTIRGYLGLRAHFRSIYHLIPIYVVYSMPNNQKIYNS